MLESPEYPSTEMMRLTKSFFSFLVLLCGLSVDLNAQVFSDTKVIQKEAYNHDVLTFQIDTKALSQALNQKTLTQTLSIPFFKGSNLAMELESIIIHSEDFQVKEKSSNGVELKAYTPGKYFTGRVIGSDDSHVVLSIHQGEISAIINYNGFAYNLGKMKERGRHILYSVLDVNEDLGLKCSANTSGVKPSKQTFRKSSTACTAIVEVYFECDYDMYQNFSSNSTSVTNYVNSMFAEVNTLYSNESIDLQISEIMVWTSNDGYSNGTNALSEFANANGTFNGDIAHLLTNDSGSNGGIAYVDQLCGNLPYAYSDIQNSSQVFPTYSWDVQVVAHEIGHNFGSAHTHDCVWGANGDEQIDDCGNIATGGGGSCYDSNNPIVPSTGGTIMSYCHLNSVGINFSNGFGAEPGNKIRNEHASCMCDNSTCPAAIVITTDGTYFAEPNNGNGASSSSASHADWFEFTPASSGHIDLYSCNEGVDTRVWLHSGSCSSLTFETMSDDDCTSSGSANYASEIVNYGVSSGVTYYIEWDNRWSTAGFNWDFAFTSSGGGPSVSINCPGNVVGINTCSTSDYHPDVTGSATSSTSGATISYTDNIVSSTCTVDVERTWVATDGGGNTASCIQLIELDDDEGPVISNCPTSISTTSNSNCQAYVTWSSPTASDECTSVSVSSTHASGSSFPVGNTAVVYTFSDQCNNDSYCTFSVAVTDGCGGGSGSTNGDCQGTHLNLSGTIQDSTYIADQTLEASGTIHNGINAMFQAGDAVELKPGFEVKMGGVLEVNIGDCGN